MKIKPYRDYITLKPRTDVLGMTTSLSLTMDAEAIERAKALSTNGTFNPKQFEIGASYKDCLPDSFAFGEVIDVGPGNRALSECRPGVHRGQVVGYTRNRIAHSFLQDGEQIHMVHEHGIVCVVEGLPSTVQLRPVSNWVLTTRDPEGFQKAIGRSFPLTGEELENGISTNHHQRPDVHGGTKMARPGDIVDSKVRMVVERVLESGPGRWVQPLGLDGRRLPAVFVENQAEPDQLAGLLRCGRSVRLYIRGVHYSLTPWQEFICAFEESEAEAATEYLGATG